MTIQKQLMLGNTERKENLNSELSKIVIFFHEPPKQTSKESRHL